MEFNFKVEGTTTNRVFIHTVHADTERKAIEQLAASYRCTAKHRGAQLYSFISNGMNLWSVTRK